MPSTSASSASPPTARSSVTNEAHGRLQQAIRAEDDTAPTPTCRRSATTASRRLPHDELPLERALRGEAFDGAGGLVRRGAGAAAGAEHHAHAASPTRRARMPAPWSISRDVTTELDALRARDELVASVSHELRTPLTSILGYLDLAIEDPDLPDHVRSNLDIAERNAERLLRHRRRHPRGIQLVVSSVEASIAPAGHRRARHRARIGGGPRPARRRHGPSRSTRPGSRRRSSGPTRCGCARSSTTCSRTRSPTTATAERSSSAPPATAPRAGSWCATPGSGITEAERARLFQRFYKAGPPRRAGHRASASRSRRDIVRAHGGELGLHSSPGVGSTFIVKLPATAHRPPRRDPAMNLDLTSVLVMTALVVNVSGILFIVETLLRRDEGAGRVWALAFLAAMLTTLAYIVWAQTPGCLVGDRRRQRRVRRGHRLHVARMPSLQRPAHGMAVGARRGRGRSRAAVAVVVEGPDGGDWAGALWMFVPLVAFAGAGAVECLRGDAAASRARHGCSARCSASSRSTTSRGRPRSSPPAPESSLFHERVRHDPAPASSP